MRVHGLVPCSRVLHTVHRTYIMVFGTSRWPLFANGECANAKLLASLRSQYQSTHRYLAMMTKISTSAGRDWPAGALCWLLTSLYSTALIARADEAAKATAELEVNEWIPNSAAGFDSSTLTWPPLQRNASSSAATDSKAQYGRAFHDNRLDSSPPLDLDVEDYKAVAVSFDSTSAPASPAPAQYHTLLKPPPLPSASSNSPFSPNPSKVLHSYQQHSHTSRDSGGYHYPVPQYLPPLPSSQYLPAPPVHTFEIESEYPDPEHYYYFQQHQHTPTAGNSTNSQLELNSQNRLFVQPGKCSNSIQVGRTRDVEVRTALKSGTQKGVCVLMLYAPNQLNKLAISLQAVQGTTNVIPTGTWLETNVKVYALQAGDIQPIFTKSNFGANSPALILTRSSNVILTFYVDRPVDFFLDISTYQSLLC